jgi:hypothetical protein
MTARRWIKRLFSKETPEPDDLFVPVRKQIKAWRKANRKMSWGIVPEEFEKIEPFPSLTTADYKDGFQGTALFYGFGDDGRGHADPILSARRAWDYALKSREDRIWQCRYVDFDRTDDIRLRPEAPSRPRGFYYVKYQPGEKYKNMTVSQIRKRLQTDTGWGPEGFQFLAVTHRHVQELMNQRKVSFMALADYDVAPHGFNDFYDAPQLFCSQDILGLGIGNIDQNYPMFGIPTLRIVN